jgi:tetratricopeptide (TPR) repeat protein
MPQPTGARRTSLALALALVAAVAALYWPVRAHGFVSYDDPVYLSENPRVSKGLDADEILWLFTHEHAANYHPLTWLAHMLDVELFGLEPGPHHLVSVGLHALNAVLVFLLARRLFGSPWTAAFAAGLFALHPLRVESVAWASERKDVLCASFFLAGLIAWLRYGERPSPGRYALVCLAALLALLAKPMAVTFPCVLLLLDAWPLGRLRGEPGAFRARAFRLLLEKLPLALLAAGGALTTWRAQSVGDAVMNVSFELRLWNAWAALGTYLRETFWPRGLAVFHPLAAIVEEDPRAALWPRALAALALVLGVLTLAWRQRRERPWLALGWLWFLGMLVPVIGLKQVGSQAHADRYTYLPLIGVAWIVAGAWGELARRPRLRPALGAVAVATCLALAVLARAQLATWKDSLTLFTHALAVTERNYVAHASLAAALLAGGDRDGARAELERALAIHPIDVPSLVSMARIARESGDLAAAEDYLRRARAVHPSKWVRYQLGCLRIAQGEPARAAREFAAALELDPSLVDARFNLGQLEYAAGDRAAARREFEGLVALAPGHAGGWNGLGALALDAGDAAAAEAHFRRAVALDPAYADALHNLGVALERQGQGAEGRRLQGEARALRAERRRAD